MQTSIPVNYKSTSNAYIAKQWLNSLPDVFAADFEAAIKYKPEELEEFKAIVEDPTTNKLDKIKYKAKLDATALDHPSHSTLTHLSVAWSESDSFVLILDNPAIKTVVLNFLTTTTKKQIWHNASYDFKHILYYTNKFPLNFEDTQIFSKTLINHVETFKAKSGLKELAGGAYGDWGISSENFDVSHMYEDKVIRYAATDACATMWIWNRINTHVESTNE